MLRTMTWNIRTGGQDRGGPDRLDRVVRVVTGARPDVLALQELRGFAAGDRLRRLAGEVGMRPYLARAWFGQPVAVLVRPPWRVELAAPVRRPFHHGAQRVRVATTSGPLTVLSAHLHPYSGTRRLWEAGWLIGAVRRAAGPLALLGGDLNTLDPWTAHQDRVARLPVAYRRRHLRRHGRIETRAVARLDRAGLVDLWRATAAQAGEEDGLTAPTEGVGAAEFSGMRLDYLFGSAPVAALTRSCRVLRGGEVERASDHRPLLAEIDLHPR